MKGKTPPDPVTRYAEAVRDGHIVASLSVQLACRRHLSDLEQQETKGLVWRPEKAQDIIDFFAEVLCLPEDTDADDDIEDDGIQAPETGTPFVLSPWQQFIVGSLFGWYAYRTSRKGVQRLSRRFKVAYVETAKGSGKTPLGAGILLYMLVADGERGAQIFTAAVTKDQAKLAFTDCEKMVASSPALRELIDEKVNNLAVLKTGSFIRPVSSEKRGLDGKRVHGAVIDELHEHATAIVVLKMRAGIKGRRNALIFIPTNSGYDRNSVCWQYHTYSRKVLDGSVANEAWFAFVCHLDACQSCQRKGKYQPSDECESGQCDDWKVEGPHWLKANPNLEVSLPWQYLREQVREAIDIPSSRNMVRRLNFCQWTDQIDVWIPAEMWAVCRGQFLPASLVGRECFIGIDLSEMLDLSSVVLVFPRPLERPGLPARDDAGAIDRAVDVLPLFWMPKNTITRRSNEDNVPYAQWAKDGHIFATAGDLIDQDAIVDHIINVLDKLYKIRGIGFDISGAAGVATRLQRHFGDDVVTVVPQSFRFLNKPSKTLEALIVSKNLAHDGNPVQAMCMGNMAKEENPWQEIRPIKMSQRQRIDGGVALIDSIWAMQNGKPSPSEVSVFFLAPRHR